MSCVICYIVKSQEMSLLHCEVSLVLCDCYVVKSQKVLLQCDSQCSDLLHCEVSWNFTTCEDLQTLSWSATLWSLRKVSASCEVSGKFPETAQCEVSGKVPVWSSLCCEVSGKCPETSQHSRSLLKVSATMWSLRKVSWLHCEDLRKVSCVHLLHCEVSGNSCLLCCEVSGKCLLHCEVSGKCPVWSATLWSLRKSVLRLAQCEVSGNISWVICYNMKSQESVCYIVKSHKVADLLCCEVFRKVVWSATLWSPQESVLCDNLADISWVHNIAVSGKCPETSQCSNHTGHFPQENVSLCETAHIVKSQESVLRLHNVEDHTGKCPVTDLLHCEVSGKWHYVLKTSQVSATLWSLRKVSCVICYIVKSQESVLCCEVSESVC